MPLALEHLLRAMIHGAAGEQSCPLGAAESLSSAAMGWRVLGAVEFVVDGAPVALGGAKQRTVVAVLVAGAGRLVTVDTLLQAIYGEDAAPTSRASLHTYVSNLRDVVGDVIVRHGDGYRLDCTNATIDAAVFEAAYRSVAGVNDAAGVASRLREALAMWRGHPYADVEAHGALDGEITRLAELRVVGVGSADRRRHEGRSSSRGGRRAGRADRGAPLP